MPAPAQAVTVSVQVQDPDNVTSVVLLVGGQWCAWQSVAMTAGTGGAYSGAIPGQLVGSIVQFYVAAQDLRSGQLRLPGRGSGFSSFVRSETDLAAAPAATLGIDSYRLIMTAADSNLMNSSTNLMSDAKLGARP